MIIDSHVHFFKDRSAATIVRKLSAISGFIPCTNGTLDGTCALLEEQGVDKALYLPVATGIDQHKFLNDFSAEVNGYQGRIISFGAIHPAAPDVEAELHRIKELGLAGVKFHPHYQEIYVDDPRVVQLVRWAARLELPLLFHAGDDPGLPPPVYAPPERIAKLLDQVEDIPGLKLIAAHMGGYAMWEQVEQHLVGRNIWMDTACTGGLIDREQYLRLIEKHGWQRILFGSDCPWQSPNEARKYLHQLELPPEQEQGILGDNLAGLLGI